MTAIASCAIGIVAIIAWRWAWCGDCWNVHVWWRCPKLEMQTLDEE